MGLWESEWEIWGVKEKVRSTGRKVKGRWVPLVEKVVRTVHRVASLIGLLERNIVGACCGGAGDSLPTNARQKQEAQTSLMLLSLWSLVMNSAKISSLLTCNQELATQQILKFGGVLKQTRFIPLRYQNLGIYNRTQMFTLR